MRLKYGLLDGKCVLIMVEWQRWMKITHRMFYNQMVAPSKIHFVSKEHGIDETINTTEDCST